MFIHKDKFFKIYFGDASDKIFKEDFVSLPANTNICNMQQFANIKKNIKLDNLVFLNQVHGTDGLVLDSFGAGKEKVVENFKVDGDFLVTNIENVGIGVLTADCLPIVFIDIINNIVAVAHAGWRGSVDGIAIKTIESMQNNFGTKLDDIKIFFGPSIKSCCYKVADDFIKNLEAYKFADMVFIKNNDGVYFDLVEFNVRLLKEFGVKEENIYLEYNLCTMCDKSCGQEFCSYRRGDKDGRQMTVVCLEF
ncbi:MAG: hypothetical protein UR12_C0030G0008 [candidate division TM6 bacterium GW2011_GWF2_30_66]|nr:MAG: hypothetical protein UR12_C0030G0008 [candidate division TM6 bacterium GW2011_GWF2_30_66]